MQELKIGDTVIAGVPDHVAEQIVKAAKAAHGRLRTAHGSGLLLQKLVPGLCRLTVPLEVVIEYWPHQADVKPSCADAPEWATHLLVQDDTRRVRWAEFKGGVYLGPPHESGADDMRLVYAIGRNGFRVLGAK